MATPPEQSEELDKAYLSSQLLVLKAGHLSNLERQDEFNQGLLNFLG